MLQFETSYFYDSSVPVLRRATGSLV